MVENVGTTVVTNAVTGMNPVVNKASLVRLDPVFRRLSQTDPSQVGGDHQQEMSISDRSFSWIDRQERRLQMRRAATRCVVGAWALLTSIAIASSLVGFVFLANMTELFSIEESYYEIGSAWQSYRLVPWLLAVMGTTLLFVGGLALLMRRFPGLRSTQSSIDWATACDAVAQLLATGCSYDQSFREALPLMPKNIFDGSSRSSSAATWLSSAIERVEAGREVFESGNAMSADELKLRLLVQADQPNAGDQGVAKDPFPAQRWQAAADHFMFVAEERLGMLNHCLPPIATILSGIMLWMSISATLGWMWRSGVGLLRGLGGDL